MPALKSTKFRLIVISTVLAAAVLLGYGAFWWAAAERFQSAALSWIGDRRAEGYTVGYSALERDGFPFRLRLTFREPALAAPAGAPPWSWAGSRLVAEITPWRPLHIDLRADGEQVVGMPDPGGTRIYSGTAKTVSASITADRTLPVRTLTAEDLILAGNQNQDVIAASRIDVALQRHSDAAGPDTGGGYDLSVQASDLRLPARLRLPLGEDVSRLTLDADVIGDPHALPWPDGLFAWRDTGGVVEVNELDVRYGPLRITGVGTMALDGAGQPMGTFNARAEGLPETIDALDRRGLFRAAGLGAASAKLAIRVLSTPSETGVPGVSGPLTLRDRTLSVASFPLLKVPAIRWPP